MLALFANNDEPHLHIGYASQIAAVVNTAQVCSKASLLVYKPSPEATHDLPDTCANVGPGVGREFGVAVDSGT